MAIISLIVMLAGAALTAYGSARAGKEQRRFNESQAAWMRYNAEMERRQAELETARVAQESVSRQADIRRRGRATTATQRSLLAASGVELAEGTPLLVVAESAAETELQARRESYASRFQMAGIYESGMLQAKHDERQAGWAIQQGKAAQRAGYMQAGSSLLQGASQAMATFR